MFDEDTIETGIREAADQQGTGSQLTPRKVVLAAAATEFISAVVPWPSHGVGHINLHYSMVNPRADEAGQEPMLKGMGWPFKDLERVCPTCRVDQHHHQLQGRLVLHLAAEGSRPQHQGQAEGAAPSRQRDGPEGDLDRR